MAEGRKRLERAVRSTLDSKQDKPRLYKGLMGAYVDGNKTIKVAKRPDFVYVRLRGATGEVIQAFNDQVAEVWDLPVLVVRDRRFPNIWRIEGRDIGQYGDWGGASYIPPHGRTHSFTAAGGDTGSDPVWIFKRQFMPFMPRPNASGTNTLYLEADYYFWEGRYHYWPGSGTDDLLQYRPTGGGMGRFVTIFMRGDEGIPDYLVGPEFSLIYPPSDPTDFIAVPDQNVGIPVAAVSLQTGTQQIGWQEIYDLRLAPSILPGTGSNLQVWNEGIALGEVSVMNFVGPNVEAIVSGTYAWVSVTGTPGGQGGVEQIGVFGQDDGVPLGTGSTINWGYGLNASISGTVLEPSLDTEPNYVWGGSHHFSGVYVRVGGDLFAEDELFVASRVGIGDAPLSPYQMLARNPLGAVSVLLDAYEAGTTVYFQDTFTDTNGTDLPDHTPDVDSVGGGWLDAGASDRFEIQSNQARFPGTHDGASVVRSWADIGVADQIVVSVRTTLNSINGGYLAAICRLDTADNTAFTARSKDDTNAYQLIDPDGTLLDSDTSHTVAPSDQIDISIELDGDDITATFVNNTQGDTVVLSATSTKHSTMTHHGFSIRLAFGDGVSDFFDDFLVQQLATGMVRSEVVMRSAAGSTGSVSAQTDSSWALSYEAHDGSDWAEHARIAVGIPTGSGWGSSDYPTQMVFAGGIVGSTSLVEWMRFQGEVPELVFNESGTFLPTRFEGVDDEQLLYLNSASGTIGIGTQTPQAKLEVIGGGRYQGDLFASGTFGLGTDQVPHGGIGWAKATFWGLNASSEGPHMTWVNSANDYPLMQFFMFAHDNFAILYDGYYESGFKVSRDDSAFRMYKIADTLVWGMETGVAAGDPASYLDILTLGQQGVVINEQAQLPYDLRVEGSSDPYLLFVDASLSRVGIGTATPDGKLHIHAGSAGAVTAAAAADDLVVEGSGDTGISILVPDGSVGSLYFGLASDNDSGFMDYDTATALLRLGAGGVLFLTIDPANNFLIWNPTQIDIDTRVASNNQSYMLFVDGGIDRVGIGTNSPQFELHVSGSLGVSGPIGAFAGDVHVTGSVYSGDGSFHTPGWLQTVDRATPTTPPTDEGRWYQQSGTPYFIDDAGAIRELGAYSAKLSYGEISAYENATATTISVQNTWYQVLIFSANGASYLTTPDHTTDDITVAQTGLYRVQVALTVTGSTGNKTYQFMVKKNNGATDFINVASGIQTQATPTRRALSLSGIISLTAGDTVELWVKCTDAVTADITCRFANLSLQQIG